MNNRIYFMAMAFCIGFARAPSTAAVSAESLAQVPLFLVESAEPLIMLNMSNDHQLFFKAYDDYSDIDGDGETDISYQNDIDYYGYFDSYKCYDYVSDVFEPTGITATKYCLSEGGAGRWSGNFLNWASMTRIDSVRKILYGGYRSTDNPSSAQGGDGKTILERAFLPNDAHSFAKHFADSGNVHKVTPFSANELTICNTTYDDSGVSENSTEPPLMRIAEGNFALWAANERWQCHWKDHSEAESDVFSGGGNNGNDSSITDLDADSNNPSWTGDRLGGGDYTVRVEVCNGNFIGQEDCKVYPDGNSKPIGLLQTYGDDEQIYFGLTSGSYGKNKSGGVVRKNIGPMTDEVNTDTDGTFNSVSGGIVDTLDRLRVSGYSYTIGDYNAGDGCPYGLNSFDNGICTNWGNPQAEIFLESLRYLTGGGNAPTAAFDANDGEFIPNLGKAASWVDPMSDDNYCAPVNVIQFNASVNSYDNDELSNAGLLDSPSITGYTDDVGDGEGITDGDYFIGQSGADTNQLCTAKSVGNLGAVDGVCPEGPRLEGGYNIAGLAYWAYTNSIRDDLSDTSGNTVDVKVKTYGVTLSPATPTIEVPVPVSGNKVYILPACRNSTDGGNCAIVDFKVVQKHAESAEAGIYTAKFYVNWETSEQGGDFDQDMAGVISYAVTSDRITVSTQTFAESSSRQMAFGYVISGTTQDGFHAHSGANGFDDFDDPSGVPDCDAGCDVGDVATAHIYTLADETSGVLELPLYYAAKWGGFEEEADADEREKLSAGAAAPDNIPNQAYEWDRDGDGMPDNYFYATNPGNLATALNSVFIDVLKETASSASTAANTRRLDNGTMIFQARFNSRDWGGELLAYALDTSSGLVSSVPTWEAGEELENKTWDNRIIITSSDGVGVPFRWQSGLDFLEDGQKTALKTNPDTGATDTDEVGEKRLRYLRGQRDNELQNGGSLRNRSRKLGDLINSSLTYMAVPSSPYPNFLETGNYSDFRNDPDGDGTASVREPMLYVGGNDGMLHGFTAAGGEERMAYVPRAVFSTLSQLTSIDYAHRYFVDGSPTVADAYFSSAWHTVAIGGLNAGGKGIYALDVTDPDDFSEANAASIVLWDITSSDTGFADLGFTFSRPAVVKNQGGTWVAMFGNGYASSNGKAVLYVVNLANGSLVDSVEVSVAAENGLSTLSPVDLDGDFKIDAVYGGDIKGNMWKFIPDGSSGDWKVAFNGQPLFTTPADSSGNVQPITTRPEVGMHPEGKPGTIVYFGTGKYFENQDNVADSNVQTFYAIWDLWDEGDSSSVVYGMGEEARYPPSSPSAVTTTDEDDVTVGGISRLTLLKQCVTAGDIDDTCVSIPITSTGEELGDYEARFVTDHSINKWDWDAAQGKMGWYIDLPEIGEKQVTSTILRGGRIIFITVVPSQHSCESGGSSWLMELDAADGSRLAFPPFDMNGDGVFDVSDTKQFDTDANGEVDEIITPGGKRSKQGIIQTPSIITSSDGKREYKYSSGSNGGIERTTENPKPLDRGRKSWIQLR